MPNPDLALIRAGLRERFDADRAAVPLLREPGVLVAVSIFWIVIGLVSWTLEFALSFGDPEGPVTLGRAAARWVYAALYWIASLLGIWLADTFTVRSWRQFPLMFFHAGAGATIAVGWSVSAYYINLAVIPGWRPEGVGRMVSTTSMMTWFFYTGLVCLAHAVLYAREYRAREIQALRAVNLATEAELNALKMQLHPHFLFNALNSVSALINLDVKAANEMVALVGEMLRRGLKQVRTQEIALAEEVKTAELYLQIEQLRFRDRLSVIWNVEPGVEEALVPHMLLQPIVENSLRHGIQAHAGHGRVEISAHRDGDRLSIGVEDDGPGPSESAGEPGFGIGLSVTQERLSKLYGGNHSFSLEKAPGGGALVRISIPYASSKQDTLQEVAHVQIDPSPDR